MPERMPGRTLVRDLMAKGPMFVYAAAYDTADGAPPKNVEKQLEAVGAA